MKKPVFPRILFFVLLYLVLFVVIVVIQFAKEGSFTQEAGNLVVTGQYRLPGENDTPAAPNEYLLAGDAHVFFGGMDFCVIKGNDGRSFRVMGSDGTSEESLPERMIIAEDSVLFIFHDGLELAFTVQQIGGSMEMLVSGNFPEGIVGAELPFKPLRKAGIRDAGDGQLVISANGINYTFGNSPVDAENRLLLLSPDAGISYHAIPERNPFSPDDFILTQASTAASYGDFLARWLSQNFAVWSRTVSENSGEDEIAALCGEAIARGTYKAALASITAAAPSFLRGTGHTYVSSVYLGNLGEAYRVLLTQEREKFARVSRQINEKSLDFLKEPGIFEYLAVRGHINLFDAGADLVRGINPAVIAMDIIPGILEGYTDWENHRPTTDNPFERLVDQACFIISESLRRITGVQGAAEDLVFAFYGNRGDTEFNLRLGRALMVYAESARDDSWAGIGRSIIISALSLGDASGAVKAGLVLSDTTLINESESGSGLNTAALYRILSPGNYHPRALTIGASVNSIWTWTAAQSVSASQENNVMDIAVSFPAGETHYMIIRGIRPFAKIQLYNMDFRTDPQFERYDSSGWSYIPQEQTLILKMKHRAREEHIRIFY